MCSVSLTTPKFTQDMGRVSVGENDAYEEASRKGVIAGYTWLSENAKKQSGTTQFLDREQTESLEYAIINATGLAGRFFVGVCRKHAMTAWQWGWTGYETYMKELFMSQFPMESLANSQSQQQE